METTDTHPGSHLEDLDIFIDLVSSKVDLEQLRQITTALSAIVTELAPKVSLIERETKVIETPGKLLRKVRVHYQI